MKLALVPLLASQAFAGLPITTIASITTVAANSGAIVRETHDLVKHPWGTIKHHGAQLKAAAKGKKHPPEPPPVPFEVATPKGK